MFLSSTFETFSVCSFQGDVHMPHADVWGSPGAAAPVPTPAALAGPRPGERSAVTSSNVSQSQSSPPGAATKRTPCLLLPLFRRPVSRSQPCLSSRSYGADCAVSFRFGYCPSP